MGHWANSADFSLRRGFARWSRAAWVALRGLAPYAVIELVMPGGSVLAIVCWLYRRRRIA